MNDTRELILDLAERSMQRGGYGGFSFRDLADALHIKTAAVHYHFRYKDDLAVAVAKRYRARMQHFFDELAQAGAPARRQVETFAAFITETLQDDRLCLFAATGGDNNSPVALIEEARLFFRNAELWLENAIRNDGDLARAKDARDPLKVARETIAFLYGAMLLGRNARSAALFTELVSSYLDAQYPAH